MRASKLVVLMEIKLSSDGANNYEDKLRITLQALRLFSTGKM